MEVTRRLRFSVRTIFGISVHDTICEYEYDEIWKKHKLRMGGSIITLEYMRHASWEAFGQARRCTTVFCPLIVWEMMLTTKTKGIINRLSAFAIKNEKKNAKRAKSRCQLSLSGDWFHFHAVLFSTVLVKNKKQNNTRKKKHTSAMCRLWSFALPGTARRKQKSSTKKSISILASLSRIPIRKRLVEMSKQRPTTPSHCE